MLDVSVLMDKLEQMSPDEELWIDVRSKSEQEALKVRIWRFLKKWRRQGEIVISLRKDEEGRPCVVLRKCNYGVSLRRADGSKELIDMRMEMLRKQMQADGLSAEEIEAILADKSAKK